MKEPKQKNIYKLSPEIWKRLKKDERHYFNKLIEYMYFHKEEFTEVHMSNEEWFRYCFNCSKFATDVYRRTKLVNRRHF